MLQAYNISDECTKEDVKTLEALKLQPPTTRVIDQLVNWSPPSSGLKLNIAEASGADGDIAGGDLVRGIEGGMVIGFYKFFGSDMTTMVEFQTLLLGLNICKEFNLTLTSVEVSSKL